MSALNTGRATGKIQSVTQIRHSVGIDFISGGRIRSPRDAERLTHLSQTKSPEVEDAQVPKLFEALYKLEKDISSPFVLREFGMDVGFNGSEVGEWPNLNLGGDSVDAETLKNRGIGIFGVPIFIIRGAHRVDGARDVQEFLEVFIKA